MKSLMFVTMFLSFNTFAMSTYTHCTAINLAKKHIEPLDLSLSREGSLDDGANLDMVVFDKNSKEVVIDGLNVEAIKITQIDTVTKSSFRMGGAFTPVSKVFAVKFHVSALEGIVTEIHGCIPRELRELDTYAICTESRTGNNRE